MRRIVGTSLLVAMWVFFAMGVGEAEVYRQQGCVVTLGMDAGGVLEEPFSRWSQEFCDMVQLRINRTASSARDAVALNLQMGAHHAFALEVVREGGVTTIASDLLDAPHTIDFAHDWPGELLSKTEQIFTMKAGGRVIAMSGEGLAREMNDWALSLRAWAATTRATAGEACQGCGVCRACKAAEFTEAVALFLGGMADPFDAAIDKNVLTITVKLDAAERPIDRAAQAEPAPDDTTARLVKRAVKAVVQAVADNAEVRQTNLAENRH